MHKLVNADKTISGSLLAMAERVMMCNANQVEKFIAAGGLSSVVQDLALTSPTLRIGMEILKTLTKTEAGINALQPLEETVAVLKDLATHLDAGSVINALATTILTRLKVDISDLLNAGFWAKIQTKKLLNFVTLSLYLFLPFYCARCKQRVLGRPEIAKSTHLCLSFLRQFGEMWAKIAYRATRRSRQFTPACCVIALANKKAKKGMHNLFC